MPSGASRVIVINPNSNQAVTEGMALALEPLTHPGGPQVECMTLYEGPFGIESQADIDAVVEPLRDVVTSREDAGAFVIACYSDPGLPVCREATDKPVFGTQECGVLTAMAQGDRFGVIALSEASIERHVRYLSRMGVLDRMAGERSANLSVDESATADKAFSHLQAVGRELRDLDGADVLVLGCAGMAAHRKGLEDSLGVPVIDPVQAAAVMAISSVIGRTT